MKCLGALFIAAGILIGGSTGPLFPWVNLAVIPLVFIGGYLLRGQP